MSNKNKLGLIIILMTLIIVIFLSLFQHHSKTVNKTSSVLVQVATVKQMPIAQTQTTYGIVNAAPEHIKQITIQNEALVQQIFVTQGQHVNKGEPLIKLSTTAKSNLNLENAKIAVDFAQKELDRVEKLRSQFLATNANVQTAKQNLAKSEAVLSNLEQQQQNETGSVLSSDCNCNIVAINVQPGQIASPATTLLTYTDTNQAQIRLGIEYDDLSKIHIGQKVIITPIYNSSLTYKGHISNITDQIDPKTGLIDVIVPLGNASGLIPGSMVEGKIVLTKPQKMLAVPRSAVLYENGRAYIFVDVNHIAVKRWVTVDGGNEQFVAIKQGLKLNETVVILGNYELSNGMLLRVESKP
ncbi:Chemiosmotic efflux system C protein B [Legionella steelei]|uniref:Chemiosmotic efflux system C protein B n=1 Tax=Legionella steelei TaxID=947033 RepID=A0A0W0ZCX9_9GAMM|nr:efflux RND transporter periplasmic adaptor subunit [Legionella steelei]KTD66691.1 Chemiosmotic efflux system C protein B [Legionella steelei]